MSERRAIVYLAWGRQHIDLALHNLKKSIHLDYPKLLVTDRNTASYARRLNVFEQVLGVDFDQPGQLRKAGLWRFLPQEYEAFLFLDTDVIVVADIELGFERAREFGIAMACAPRYNLDHYDDLRPALEASGLEPRGYQVYNTGVIFFSRRPGVERVFLKWEQLVREHAVPGKGGGDQPYLTLAMELLHFNPYTLSPSYNYRAFGEKRHGDIRVWHSYMEIPADLNRYRERGAFRRGVDSYVESLPFARRLLVKLRRFIRDLF